MLSNLMKMNLFRLFKMKKLWVFSGIIFIVAYFTPFLGKIFGNLLLNVAQSANDAQSLAEAQYIVDQLNAPVNMSTVFVSPYGGFTILMILVMVSAASYLCAPNSKGYIKNYIGLVGNKGNIVIADFLTICIHNMIMLTAGLLGTFFGTLSTHQIIFDEGIPMSLLIYLIKFLLMMSVSAIVMFLSLGLRNKTLAVVVGVLIGSGALEILYLPLNFGLSKLFQSDIDVQHYVPDKLFAWYVNIYDTTALSQEQFIINALIVSAVVIFMFGGYTYILFRKKDIK